MNSRIVVWAPAVILTLGWLCTLGGSKQRSLPLRTALDASVPREIAGVRGRDVQVPEAERRVAGMTSYVLRVYSPNGTEENQIAADFSVYVGYYAAQMQGHTIHSPKNCLPGAGWEALTATAAVLQTESGPVRVNRYILRRGQEKAVVLYWYQGRGRVEANEYRVKWNLLRDAAIYHRSDEALVRVVVPATTSEDSAYVVAARVASRLVPAVARSLPGRGA